MGIKVVKDLVHGYIEMDEKIQKCVDTPHFQRLHRVKQLTCNLLFPSVNHSRYEHSLGVMKLACDFWERVKELLKNEKIEQERLESVGEHLRFAALLHDVGHPAFSHLGEKFLEKEAIYKEILANSSSQAKGKETFYQGETLMGSAHELNSCYVILEKLKEVLPEDLDPYFLCRMIVGNPYPDSEKYLENMAVQILNSSSIDVDKLDYLMRDNHMTGEIAPLMDIKRLLASLGIDEEKKLCFVAKAIPAVQSVVDSRDSLYLWVYHHHISVYADFVLGEMLRQLFEEGEILQEDFFSPKAIADELIADDDIYSLLRRKYREAVKKGKKTYFLSLAEQFFERKFLKSVWKTIYEYHDLEQEWIEKSYIPSLEKLEEFFKTEQKWKALLEDIRKHLSLEEGEVFLISQHHKFYHSLNKSPMEVLLGKEKRALSELLPQKNFEKFHHLSFFFYVREDKRMEAREIFPKYLQKHIQ